MNQTAGTPPMMASNIPEPIPLDDSPAPARLSAPKVAAMPGGQGRPLNLPPGPPSTPNCEAACVMDATTGKIIYNYNGDSRRQVASTQKVLTALVIMDKGGLNKPITIHPSDTHAEPTKLGLRSGEVYTKGELLRALMVKSYNDVALALARDTSGSVPAFVADMNSKAKSLGMRNSYFCNPNGLPAPQYSTACDMAKCAYFAYRNPAIRHMVNTQKFSFHKANGSNIMIENTNKLLSKHSWVNGMKTGYTNAAGRCLISTGSMNGRNIIVVILGCKPSQIWSESEKLLAWGLQLHA